MAIHGTREGADRTQRNPRESTDRERQYDLTRKKNDDGCIIDSKPAHPDDFLHHVEFAFEQPNNGPPVQLRTLNLAPSKNDSIEWLGRV